MWEVAQWGARVCGSCCAVGTCLVLSCCHTVILQQYSFVLGLGWLVLVCSELLLGTVGRLNLWLLGVASVARKSF